MTALQHSHQTQAALTPRRSLRERVETALQSRRYARSVGSNRSMRSLRSEYDRRGGQPGTLRRPAE